MLAKDFFIIQRQSTLWPWIIWVYSNSICWIPHTFLFFWPLGWDHCLWTHCRDNHHEAFISLGVSRNDRPLQCYFITLSHTVWPFALSNEHIVDKCSPDTYVNISILHTAWQTFCKIMNWGQGSRSNIFYKVQWVWTIALILSEMPLCSDGLTVLYLYCSSVQLFQRCCQGRS